MVNKDMVNFSEVMVLFCLFSGSYFFSIKILSSFKVLSKENRKRKMLFCVLGATFSIVSNVLFSKQFNYLIEIIYFVVFSKIILKSKLLPSLSTITLVKIVWIVVEILTSEALLKRIQFMDENESKIIYCIIQYTIINILFWFICTGIKHLLKKRK